MSADFQARSGWVRLVDSSINGPWFALSGSESLDDNDKLQLCNYFSRGLSVWNYHLLMFYKHLESASTSNLQILWDGFQGIRSQDE